MAERKLLPEPLQSIMEADESLYGVDETLALGITNVYGMIGLTSFGYLDKVKPGIIQELNNSATRIHVFLDDLIAGLAAAASARIAHKNKKRGELPPAGGSLWKPGRRCGIASKSVQSPGLTSQKTGLASKAGPSFFYGSAAL